MANRGFSEAIEILFVIIIMLIIWFSFGSFLSQLVGASPEQKALSDAQEAIEHSCSPTGSSYQEASIVLPQGNKIELKKLGGILELTKDSDVISKKTLKCPDKTIFTNCVIGPASEGREGIVLGINKTTDVTTKQAKITLNATGTIFSCEA